MWYLLIPNVYNAKVNGEEFELGRGKTSPSMKLRKCSVWIIEYIPKRKVSMIKHCVPIQAHKLLGWTPT